MGLPILFVVFSFTYRLPGWLFEERSRTSLVKKTGKFNNEIHPANFYVLIKNDVPAALIEMGFLTNPSEADHLIDDTYQNRLAEGICNGIVTYFNSSKKTP